MDRADNNEVEIVEESPKMQVAFTVPLALAGQDQSGSVVLASVAPPFFVKKGYEINVCGFFRSETPIDGTGSISVISDEKSKTKDGGFGFKFESKDKWTTFVGLCHVDGFEEDTNVVKIYLMLKFQNTILMRNKSQNVVIDNVWLNVLEPQDGKE